jgi:hypothetical protein
MENGPRGDAARAELFFEQRKKRAGLKPGLYGGKDH